MCKIGRTITSHNYVVHWQENGIQSIREIILGTARRIIEVIHIIIIIIHTIIMIIWHCSQLPRAYSGSGSSCRNLERVVLVSESTIYLYLYGICCIGGTFGLSVSWWPRIPSSFCHTTCTTYIYPCYMCFLLIAWDRSRLYLQILLHMILI